MHAFSPGAAVKIKQCNVAREEMKRKLLQKRGKNESRFKCVNK
jgi:hypothetical protein